MKSIQIIPFLNLFLSAIPVLIVVIILWKWKADYKNAIWATLRMVLQLLLIGYVLSFIFSEQNPWIVLPILAIMIICAGWIGLRTVKNLRRVLYSKSLLAILVGGGSVLVLVTQGVLDLDPWYLASYTIPLAGMIFANCMNSISLASERVQAEMENNVPYDQAKVTALQASLIPITNALFAVGLVSLPGMMTGQILSGVSPLIAVRYQVMVMCMTFGSAGISSAVFLVLTKGNFLKVKE